MRPSQLQYNLNSVPETTLMDVWMDGFREKIHKLNVPAHCYMGGGGGET